MDVSFQMVLAYALCKNCYILVLGLQVCQVHQEAQEVHRLLFHQGNLCHREVHAPLELRSNRPVLDLLWYLLVQEHTVDIHRHEYPCLP